jgi:flagella basal body P-ring formation protein FlgA
MKRFSLLLLITLAQAPPLALANEVVLRPKAMVTGPVVHVGDVAEIRGLPVDRVNRLAALPLMPAPASGTQRFLSSREIEDMLHAHGENTLKLIFTGAATVAIERIASRNEPRGHALPPGQGPAEGQTTRLISSQVSAAPANAENAHSVRQEALLKGKVTASMAPPQQDTTHVTPRIEQAIANHLVKKTGTAEGWRVVCKLSDRQQQLLAAAGADVACAGGAAPWNGRQRFELSFVTSAGPQSFPVTAEVALSRPVVVAMRPIARGAIITAADVQLQLVDNVPAPVGRRTAMQSLDVILGMEATRPLQSGEIVFSDQVQLPRLVKKGDAISVIAEGRGIRVRTTARALEDAALNELVTVESLDTKATFDARVIGVREAAILAAPSNNPYPPSVGAHARGEIPSDGVNPLRK